MNQAATPRGLSRIPAQQRTTVVLIALWLLLLLVTGIMHPSFWSASTFLAISFNMIVAGVVALGLSIVTISGALLDLSNATTVAIASVAVATVLRATDSTPLALLAGLAVGIIVGIINATLVVAVGVNPIVATLAVSFGGGGLLIVYAGGIQQTVPLDSALTAFGNQRWLGIPAALVIVIALIVLVELYLTRTRPGRHLVAVGGNPKAASTRGISVRRVRVLALLASGILAAIGGILLASQTSVLSTTPNAQLAYQTAAVVLLGGISLSGGRGQVTGLFASLLLLSTVPTAIVSFGLPSSWQIVLQGAAIFIAVCLDARRTRSLKK